MREYSSRSIKGRIISVTPGGETDSDIHGSAIWFSLKRQLGHVSPRFPRLKMKGKRLLLLLLSLLLLLLLLRLLLLRLLLLMTLLSCYSYYLVVSMTVEVVISMMFPRRKHFCILKRNFL